VKAFRFRLDQAFRWRETQVSLQKARLAAAIAQLATIANSLETQQAALSNASTRLFEVPTGDALQSFAAFKNKTLASIRALEVQATAAQSSVTLEMNLLVEANRKVRLLENLKRTDQTRWQHDFDHELAVFADEAFLSRRQSTLQSK
jgi:hypothetical protein